MSENQSKWVKNSQNEWKSVKMWVKIRLKQHFWAQVKPSFKGCSWWIVCVPVPVVRVLWGRGQVVDLLAQRAAVLTAVQVLQDQLLDALPGNERPVCERRLVVVQPVEQLRLWSPRRTQSFGPDACRRTGRELVVSGRGQSLLGRGIGRFQTLERHGGGVRYTKGLRIWKSAFCPWFTWVSPPPSSWGLTAGFWTEESLRTENTPEHWAAAAAMHAGPPRRWGPSALRRKHKEQFYTTENKAIKHRNSVKCLDKHSSVCVWMHIIHILFLFIYSIYMDIDLLHYFYYTCYWRSSGQNERSRKYRYLSSTCKK